MNAQRTPLYSEPMVTGEYWWATAHADTTSEPGFLTLSSDVYDKSFRKLASLSRKIPFSLSGSSPVGEYVVPFCVGPRDLYWWYIVVYDSRHWYGFLVGPREGLKRTVFFDDPYGTFKPVAAGMGGIAGYVETFSDVSELVLPSEWEFLVLRFLDCSTVFSKSGPRSRYEYSMSSRIASVGWSKAVNGRAVRSLHSQSYREKYQHKLFLSPDLLSSISPSRIGWCDGVPDVDVLREGVETVEYDFRAAYDEVNRLFVFPVPHSDLLVYDTLSGSVVDTGHKVTYFKTLVELNYLFSGCFNERCYYFETDVCCKLYGPKIVWEFLGYPISGSIRSVLADERVKNASGTLKVVSGGKTRYILGTGHWVDYYPYISLDFSYGGGWVTKNRAGKGSVGYACLLYGNRGLTPTYVLVTDTDAYEGIAWEVDDPLYGVATSAVYLVDDEIVSFKLEGGRVVAVYRSLPTLGVIRKTEAPSGDLHLVHYTAKLAEAWGVA